MAAERRYGTVDEPNEVVGLSLSPGVTARVGSEVIVLASVRTAAGYLVTNQRIEWSLTPGSVGEITDVGRNGLSDFLLGDLTVFSGKVNTTYAVGMTSYGNETLLRNRCNPCGSVHVRSGQGWLAVSSPCAGTSYVTAVVPGIRSLECRKRTTLINWTCASACARPVS